MTFKNVETGEVLGKETQAIVQFKGEPITITAGDVKDFICPTATHQEVVIFLKTCQSLQLNPFAGEIYLIKYDERDKAAQVIAIESYLKAAEQNPSYDGHEAGIILKNSDGKLEYREGAFLLDEERNQLEGGWAKVYRKDRSKPYYVAVHKKECIKHTKDGYLTKFWIEEKQPWMLRKVALSRALVEAFPSLFAGLAPAEIELAAEIEAKANKELIDITTGEITEVDPRWVAGQGVVIETESTPPEEKPIKVRTPKSSPPKGEGTPKLKRDISKILTLLDMQKACFEDFDMQPRQVYVELDVSSLNDITQPPQVCYLQIAAVRMPKDKPDF